MSDDRVTGDAHGSSSPSFPDPHDGVQHVSTLRLPFSFLFSPLSPFGNFASSMFFLWLPIASRLCPHLFCSPRIARTKRSCREQSDLEKRPIRLWTIGPWPLGGSVRFLPAQIVVAGLHKFYRGPSSCNKSQIGARLSRVKEKAEEAWPLLGKVLGVSWTPFVWRTLPSWWEL